MEWYVLITMPKGRRLYANKLCVTRVDAALKETGRETLHDAQSIGGWELLADLRAKAE